LSLIGFSLIGELLGKYALDAIMLRETAADQPAFWWSSSLAVTKQKQRSQKHLNQVPDCKSWCIMGVLWVLR